MSQLKFARRRIIPRWKKRRPPLVVIDVGAGVVQQVFASDQRIEVVCVNSDLGAAGTDQHSLDTANNNFQEHPEVTVTGRPHSLRQLPIEIRQIVEHATSRF